MFGFSSFLCAALRTVHLNTLCRAVEERLPVHKGEGVDSKWASKEDLGRPGTGWIGCERAESGVTEN